MNAEQDNLYHDFHEMASNAGAVEIDVSDFVRYCNYDSSTLEIEFQDDNGGYRIFIDDIHGSILDGLLSWNEDEQAFNVKDEDGYDHTIRFMNVVPIERKVFK